MYKTYNKQLTFTATAEDFSKDDIKRKLGVATDQLEDGGSADARPNGFILSVYHNTLNNEVEVYEETVFYDGEQFTEKQNDDNFIHLATLKGDLGFKGKNDEEWLDDYEKPVTYV